MDSVKSLRHTYIACIVFFLIITAQTFWSTIHGDGAVYAWLIKETAENTASLFSHPLQWTRTGSFTDHPYLFFYLSAPLVALFGSSDVGIKIPNYIIGFLSLYLVYKTVLQRFQNPSPALLACYVLITNPLYELMIRQPTLDPLAQLFSLLAVFMLLYGKHENTLRYFVSGLFMGFAFLTKGLEMLPNLGALFIVGSVYIYKNNLNPFKLFGAGMIGLILPMMIWIGYDRLFWNQQWTNSYIAHQMRERFFGDENTQTLFSLSYVRNLISKYIIQILIIAWGSYQTLKQKKTLDLFWVFTMCYSFLNILAFSLIKKDSSQHLTGIFVFSSVLIGPYLYEIYQSIENKSFSKLIPYIHVVILVAVTGMWTWLITQKNNKVDLWNFIRSQQNYFEVTETQLPLVVDPSISDSSGVYFTGQWYWPSRKIHFRYEADTVLKGKEVILLVGKDDNSFTVKKMVY